MSHTLVSPDSLLGRSTSPAPPFFSCWVDGDRDAVWVRVAGELNLARVPQLKRILRGSGSQARLIVLDLRELTFLARPGAQAIVEASVQARQLGRRLVLLSGRPEIVRTLTLTENSEELEIRHLDAGEPAVQVLLQLAEQELALVLARSPA
jgi:anti-anti-sigma factor